MPYKVMWILNNSQGKSITVMSSKRNFGTAHATFETDEEVVWKASEPKISYHSANQYWRIRCNHFSTKGKAGVRKEATHYLSEIDAQSEVDLFRFAVHTDAAIYWDNWFSVPDLISRNAGYKDKLASMTQPRTPYTIGSSVLNAAGALQLNKLRKVSPNLSRVDYFNIFTSGQQDF